MISRRRFLQSSLTVALVPLIPRAVFSTTTLRLRPNWDNFCTGPLFQVFLDTVTTMKANTNADDPASWTYWVNVHKNFCPHKVAYFLAWHRGFLYRLEAQLRKVSGNASLVIPYWDYCSEPLMPAAFTDSTSPLYISNRAGTDVTNALSLNPFADTIINFQRGLTYAFEPTLESLPHNPVHNLIGGPMGSVTISPVDPIFWVHHANIDRLWCAWVNAGNGRAMPDRTDPYWSGSFNYGPGVSTMGRAWTISATGLGYEYEDETMPTALPGTPAAAQPVALTLQALSSTLPGALGVSLGSGQPLALDERSVSIAAPLSEKDRNQVRSLLMMQSTHNVRTNTNSSVTVVLDGVRVTELGKKGGYFYKIYINLPAQQDGSQPESTYLLGTLGAFEVSGMLNHQTMMGNGAAAAADGVQIAYPATEALEKIWPSNLDNITISFVRVDGNKPAKGPVIIVKDFRIETTN
jgi:tyrosinase